MIRLTPLERRIVALLVEGYPHKQIATELHIQRQVVSNYVCAIAQRVPEHGRPTVRIIRYFTKYTL